MENLFNYSLRRCYEEIEYEILTAAFGKFLKDDFYNMGLSLDAVIIAKVLDNSVVKDISMISGTEVTIALAKSSLQRVTDYVTAVNIPTNLRGGRRILEVYNVSSGTGENGRRGLDAGLNRGASITTRCNMIAPNTFTFEHPLNLANDLYATCILASDEHLSHIPVKAFDLFADMVVAKCKQLIFTTLNIRMGDSHISRGKELGVFSDRVRGWSDAGETYRDLLRKWRRTESLLDTKKKEKTIKLLMGRMPR